MGQAKQSADDEFLDRLAKGLVDGSVRPVSVGPVVCGKCKVGKPVGSPTPNWMNRTICDHCGHKGSR